LVENIAIERKQEMGFPAVVIHLLLEKKPPTRSFVKIQCAPIPRLLKRKKPTLVVGFAIGSLQAISNNTSDHLCLQFKASTNKESYWDWEFAVLYINSTKSG
jgi:hypothetical protein